MDFSQISAACPNKAYTVNSQLNGFKEPVNCPTHRWWIPRPPWPRPSYLKPRVNLLKLLTLDTVSRRAHKPYLGCSAFRKQAEIQLVLSYHVMSKQTGAQRMSACTLPYTHQSSWELKSSPTHQFDVRVNCKYIWAWGSLLQLLFQSFSFFFHRDFLPFDVC